MILLNPVVISVALVLTMCLLRINVVISLTTGSILCGIISGLSVKSAVSMFSIGLSGGAKIALSYAILGAFASALAHSGMPDFAMSKLAKILHFRSEKNLKHGKMYIVDRPIKYALFLAIALVALACKNIIPVHIAFIPVLIPPLLHIFNGLKIDRRAVSCIITWGVIVAYSTIPMGFGEIFLVNILSHYLSINGLTMTLGSIIKSLSFPLMGMTTGLILALFVYRHPRHYLNQEVKGLKNSGSISENQYIISCAAVLATLVIQLVWKDSILSALSGFLLLSMGGVIKRKDSDDVVANGLKMMSVISFTMIAAAGFGHMLRESGGIDIIVNWMAEHAMGNNAIASFGMLFVGLLISIGIGSSFSTVPIIASVYVPLGLRLGFSPSAIAIIVAISGIVGDAGSPASGSILGPNMGLNADGQHVFVRDSLIPAFLYLSIPAFVFGWIGSLVL